MDCKNCELPIRTDFSFCANCGAKVIRNRLTLKNLWYDVTERYFNIDNNFLKTFFHLFTKPEQVIEGYVLGVRKKYLNPISYLGIALTLSGFTVFLLKRNLAKIDMDVFGVGVQANEGTEAIFNFTADFQALLFVLYIPMMAIASWMTFDDKKHNFTERIVIFSYALAHYSIVIFIPSIIILSFFPEAYTQMAFVFLSCMYLYSAYVIKRISTKKGIDIIARIIVFMVLFTMQYIAMSILIPFILILTGHIDFKEFMPKP